MRRFHLLVAATLALGLPGSAAAKDKPKFVESSHVADKPTVSLDPARAYVMLRAEAAAPVYLMKEPTPEDQAAYDRLRREALAEAHTKYLKKLAEREAAGKDPAATGSRAADDGKLVEPTEANFEFTPFGLLAAVPIGPANRFSKAGGVSTYLEAVTPGRYRIYGVIFAGQNGQMIGGCFCMGSVGFDAKAGEIVDLGVLTKADNADRPVGMTAFAVGPLRPASATEKPDLRLAAAVIRPAQFHPVGKLPNYFGLTISRLPEMPGVMRYDRDRIVDLTASR